MNLDTVRRHALSLPESVEQPHFDFTSFRVGGKIFATAPPDGAHLHLFVDEATRARALAAHPLFMEPLVWGGKVVGLRIALRSATLPRLAPLIDAAWMQRAPKAIRALWEERPPASPTRAARSAAAPSRPAGRRRPR